MFWIIISFLPLNLSIYIHTQCRIVAIYFPGGSAEKNPPAMQEMYRRHGFDPWVGKIPWRRKRQHIPVFLPGKFHGQRSLAGYSPWDCKELDTTEHAHTHNLVLYFGYLSISLFFRSMFFKNDCIIFILWKYPKLSNVLEICFWTAT